MERKHFDSVNEFCNQPYTVPANRGTMVRELGDNGNWKGGSVSWLGARTANEAAKRATHGWPEGVEQVMTALADLEVPTPVDVKRRVVRADQGDELDIHAVNRGQLATAWTSRRRRNARGPFLVRVIAQTNMLYDVTAEQLFWRGAAMVKMVDILTSAGYSVQVIGATASDRVSGTDGDFLHTYTLKESGAPLDLPGLTGVICNAGFHRLYGFRAYLAAAKRAISSTGAGSSETYGRIIREQMVEAEDDGVPTFCVPYNVLSKRQAETWLAEATQQLDMMRDLAG